MSKKIPIEKKVLSENDRIAGEIRVNFSEHGIVALNLVSSPGSGKTSLLERTLGGLAGRLNMAMIAGDVQTENDAIRLKRAGGRIVKPIVTGGACHLDARMISKCLNSIELVDLDMIFIENVGNLVCPSSYDLGEDFKVVLISTTEGDDKPLKYPSMFRRSSAMVINKMDLMGFSDFNLARVKENAWSVNPQLTVFEMSCRSNEGLQLWYEWLIDLARMKKTK